MFCSTKHGQAKEHCPLLCFCALQVDGVLQPRLYTCTLKWNRGLMLQGVPLPARRHLVRQGLGRADGGLVLVTRRATPEELSQPQAAIGPLLGRGRSRGRAGPQPGRGDAMSDRLDADDASVPGATDSDSGPGSSGSDEETGREEDAATDQDRGACAAGSSDAEPQLAAGSPGDGTATAGSREEPQPTAVAAGPLQAFAGMTEVMMNRYPLSLSNKGGVAELLGTSFEAIQTGTAPTELELRLQVGAASTFGAGDRARDAA